MRAIIAPAPNEPAVLTDIDAPRPGDGEVLIEVSHSSVNYKDGSTVLGRPGFVRTWPLTVGIDIVGTVVETTTDAFTSGDRVTLNGAGAGENRPGGYAEYATAPAASLVKVPESITSAQAAAIGTAGFTAALAVLAIEDHGLKAGDGEVLVTGAAGGVGSVAINLLARRGYSVTASTGRKAQEHAYLTGLGASRVIDRQDLAEPASAPLQEQRWAAVVDGVGSHTLANALAQTRYGGIAVAYGLAQGADLPVTVLPFILRAVTLTGANSVDAPLPLRQRAWDLLSHELDLDALDRMSTTIGLADVLDTAPRILAGQVRGRTIVDLTR
ncbi:MDR family oxidoreductase [Leucobacter massiliensis]|uniref:Oxidoreductase n=1 Tax=Leucobacter massiliensis TaxID=1686285 RepID=A0A2S9QLJ0_9MICO|nr:MDR family oxidoreductase [Leucobacter massiliensis]PRI10460.1 oxidoreductase [Leucobacter massiliensis]